jgi:hypothetical protein
MEGPEAAVDYWRAEMIYRAVELARLVPGCRVAYLGAVRTVVEVRRDGPGGGFYIKFRCGTEGRFFNEVSAVDEQRTANMLARYGCSAPVRSDSS